MIAGSSGGNAFDYNENGRGSALHTGRPLLDQHILEGYWSMTGNLTTADKGIGYPTPPCRWPSKIVAATCPSATLI